MAFRKRRRFPTSKLVSYLCATCGVIFILGNVLMLHEGFVQLYESAMGRGDHPGAEVLWNSQYMAHDKMPHDGLSGSLRLPASVLSMETHLRRLMGDGRHLSNVNTSNAVISAAPRDIHVTSISSEDLRRMLTTTSSCRYIGGISDKTEVVGSGWTKLVFKAKYKGAEVAIKNVDINGHDVFACMQNTRLSRAHCVYHAADKLLKEMVLLNALRHHNIVQMHAHCVPGDGDQAAVSLVTELGNSVDLIQLLQMSWENRLRVVYDVTMLLHFLAYSPLGSLVINDFRRQQFVIVDGVLKLTDLDDMGFEEQSCVETSDCVIKYSSANVTLRTQCIDGLCHGMNEKKNIFNAGRHFTTFLLPHGAPFTLKPRLHKLVDNYNNATWPITKLKTEVEELVDIYKSGKYLREDKPDRTSSYTMYHGIDVQGLHDYRCRYSLGAAECTVSVFDIREAEDLCDLDEDCIAFVISDITTWTGRMLAHLKDQFSGASTCNHTDLYLRPGLRL